jgi:methylated-DNA-[protein]-cysteine S-methyltransferase
MSKNFNQRVWQLLKKIPRGRVTTYKEIGRRLHSKAYRAVGSACHRNPYAPVAACHRVVNSDGSLGGFAGGLQKKIALLEADGVRIKNKKIMGFEKIFFRFR